MGAAILLSAGERNAALAQENETVSIALPAQSPAIATVPVFVSREVVQTLPGPDIQVEIAAGTASIAKPVAQSLAELVANTVPDAALSQEMRCLAGAVYHESRGEPLAGQLAVAKVVINRRHSPLFPKSYCAVVYQRAQFSFVRGGVMPPIREDSAAWRTARAIAQIAHHDHYDSAAEDALFFHANYVRPGWSKRRVAAATINRHIFYR